MNASSGVQESVLAVASFHTAWHSCGPDWRRYR